MIHEEGKMIFAVDLWRKWQNNNLLHTSRVGFPSLYLLPWLPGDVPKSLAAESETKKAMINISK